MGHYLFKDGKCLQCNGDEYVTIVGAEGKFYKVACWCQVASVRKEFMKKKKPPRTDCIHVSICKGICECKLYKAPKKAKRS